MAAATDLVELAAALPLQAPSAAELLAVWERAAGQAPLAQALALLACALPAPDAERIARLPIGQRDVALLRLRGLIFGPRIASVVDCPVCHQHLEMTLDGTDLQPLFIAGPPTVTLQVDDYELIFRCVNSQDLQRIAAVGTDDAGRVRAGLLAGCLLAARRQGRELALDALPPAVIDALEQRIALADPGADVRLALVCPACAHAWLACFDIVRFFWIEIDAWAKRMLREVHVLASAYGWHEAEILHLSALRRQRYLEMVEP